MTKTRQEVEDLKADWIGDPCWDIEDTEDFEDHKTELMEFRLSKEADWRKKEDDRIAARAKSLECSVALVRYLENLERKVDLK